MELPQGEADKSFNLKLNGSFMHGLNEEEKGCEINLFNLRKNSTNYERSNETPTTNTVYKEEAKEPIHDLSLMSIKSTLSKMKNRSKSKGQMKTIINGF